MKKLVTIGLIIALMAASVGCSRPGANADINEEAVDQTPIKVATVTTETVKETFYGVGEMKAKDEYSVMTGQSGTVESISVKVGDAVTKGQILMKLENSSLIRTVNNTETSLRTQMNLNKITLDNAQDSFEETKALYDVGATSKNALDSAENALEQAKLNYNNSVQNYNATTKNNQEDLADTYIKSPIDGVIAAKYVDVNEDVQNVTAFKVVNTSMMVAEINVPEHIVDSIQEGQDAMVYLNGSKDTFVEGHVASIDEVTGDNSYLYPVEIQVDNTNAKLKSGMYIEAEIVLEARENQVVVPKSAVLEDANGTHVYVEKEGIAERRDVKIGYNEAEMVEVLSGLKKGETLIIRGQDYLDDGDAVRIIE